MQSGGWVNSFYSNLPTKLRMGVTIPLLRQINRDEIFLHIQTLRRSDLNHDRLLPG